MQYFLRTKTPIKKHPRQICKTRTTLHKLALQFEVVAPSVRIPKARACRTSRRRHSWWILKEEEDGARARPSFFCYSGPSWRRYSRVRVGGLGPQRRSHSQLGRSVCCGTCRSSGNRVWARMEPLIRVDPLGGPTYENPRSGPRVLRPLDIDFNDITYTVHEGKGWCTHKKSWSHSKRWDALAQHFSRRMPSVRRAWWIFTRATFSGGLVCFIVFRCTSRKARVRISRDFYQHFSRPYQLQLLPRALHVLATGICRMDLPTLFFSW